MGGGRMLNSRDIDLLRKDVAANCRLFCRLCQAAGAAVLVTGTVRDDAFQQQCYERGTGGRPPATFHSVNAGLAFDVCQNIKGREYNDRAFWQTIAPIGKKMGFTWGGDWKRVDKPHFQWDARGAFSDADIRAGRYPPAMPPYQETKEETMTEEDVRRIAMQVLAERAPVYHTLSEVPLWGKKTASKLMARGLLQGDGADLGLSYELLRSLVLQDRAGVWDEGEDDHAG